METVTGIVIAVKRHGCTVWGNPMHSVDLLTSSGGDGSNYQTFRLSNDASLNYAINNREYRDEPHTFVLTRAGRISHDI